MAESGARELIERIESVKSIEHLTKAMAMVSSAKLRVSKVKLEKTRRHFQIVTDSIQEVFNHVQCEEVNPYLTERDVVKNRAYILIASNRGLCGSFNDNVIEKGKEMIVEKEGSHIIAIGSKGADYFNSQGYNVIKEYVGPPENISFLDVKMMVEPILESYLQEEFDELHLIYTSFQSSLKQIPGSVKLLPFQIQEEEKGIEKNQMVEYEPSPEAVFQYLLPAYVNIMIFRAIMESLVSENAARRMAMENASENSKEMIEELTFEYNTARQSAVTQEMLEIIGGAQA